MIPDSVYLVLLVMCILGATFAHNLDRHLEPADHNTEPDDDHDARRDEWAEEQAIERQWDTRH